MVDRAGKEATDLANVRSGGERRVIAEGRERAAQLLALADVGLKLHPTVGVEPEPVGARQQCYRR